MGTGLLKGLAAAILAVAIGAACTREPARAAKTPDEVRQLINVTDSVVGLVRTLSASDESSSELRPAIRQFVTALDAARPQFNSHSAAIGNAGNVAATACVKFHTLEVSALDTLVEKLHEASLQKDAALFQRRKGMLIKLAHEATQCADMATRHFVTAADLDQEAVADGIIVIGEIYAVATAFRAAAGLGFSTRSLLQDQIAAYETVATRLGPERKEPVVMDALPKLRSALSLLPADPA